MSEVSCHVFEVFKRPFAVKGIPFDDIVKGTAVSLARLKDKNGRMTWTEFVAIMKNIRPHFTDVDGSDDGVRNGCIIHELSQWHSIRFESLPEPCGDATTTKC